MVELTIKELGPYEEIYMFKVEDQEWSFWVDYFGSRENRSFKIQGYGPFRESALPKIIDQLEKDIEYSPYWISLKDAIQKVIKLWTPPGEKKNENQLLENILSKIEELNSKIDKIS